MTGKGSAPRPFSVDNETFNKNFDAIFRNKNSPIPQCPVAETGADQVEGSSVGLEESRPDKIGECNQSP